MKLFPLYEDETLFAGCTLRDPTLPCEGSLALHTNDPAAAILHNRKLLSEACKIPLDAWCLANQTHSASAHEATQADRGKGAYAADSAILSCDALYSNEDRLLIGVFTADCIPLLIYDPTSSYIGAIHSGWPGTVKQITMHTVETLIQKGLCPSSTRVWIGPCIHQRSFQIKEDVIKQVQALPFDTAPYLQFQPDQSALCDNVGLNVKMLTALGITEENIHICVLDTYQEEQNCFSYRRNHTSYRHFSFIYKK